MHGFQQWGCEQAVAEGDAMKADKRRKKKMQEMEQAADPIFGGSDESDGGDYIPDNAEEPEYIEAGVDQEDEAEGAEEADGLQESGEGQGRAFRKRILAGTGEGPQDAVSGCWACRQDQSFLRSLC